MHWLNTNMRKKLHSHASVIMRARYADVPFIYQRSEDITSLKPYRSWGAVYSHWNVHGIQPNIFCTHRNQFPEILVSSISYWASNSCMYAYFEKQLMCGLVFWIRFCDFLRLASFMLRFFEQFSHSFDLSGHSRGDRKKINRKKIKCYPVTTPKLSRGK